MFTGIVQERGRLIDDPMPSGQGGVRLALGHSADLGRRLEIGASLAVSGVCLTITELDGDPPLGSVVELSPETLARTTLGSLRRGDHVNLETALRMGDALGGHLVAGHVDGLAKVIGWQPAGEGREIEFEVPAELAHLVADKGSVALQGVSLTPYGVHGRRFKVSLVPHTLAQTTLGSLSMGDAVHFEADLLARYVARMLEWRQAGQQD